jgi:hypothetical protein
MDIKKLLGLRPKEENAAAIAAAIASAEAAQAEALSRAEQLKAGRGQLLLTGDAGAVEAGERELAEVQMEADRCGEMAAALRQPLAQARTREKVEEIKALNERAGQDVSASISWWREEYPGLVAKLRAGVALEQRAMETLAELSAAAMNNRDAYAAAGVTPPKAPHSVINPASVFPLGYGVQLPNVPSEDVGTRRRQA